MVHVTIVMADGKTLAFLKDNRRSVQIVSGGKLVTTTGTESLRGQAERQHFFLTLAGPTAR